MTDLKTLTALNQRVWYVVGGVHPSRVPQFLSQGKFSDDPSKTIGEETKISAPDPNNFDRDIEVGTVPGETERATLGIGTRSTALASILLDWTNRACRVDIFALSGKCGNPQDFTEGGEKWVYFPDGRISSHSYENFGAYGRDENNPTNEMVDMTSEDYWEFRYMRQDQIGAGVTTREIRTIDTYQGDNCDSCPDPCERVFMTMVGASATPGTQPSMLYSDDGGTTWSSDTIDTMFSNETINDAAAFAGVYVLISNTSNSIHWTQIDAIFEGNNTWQEVISGFVAGKGPNAMTALDIRHVWIVGDGGYIYFAQNFKSGVTVQDAGVSTTQNLNAVHAVDSNNVLVVGNSNVVLSTANGGQTWESITGPAVGVNLGACWMWDEKTWIVGEGAGGNGKLWLTTNSGVAWSEIGLPAAYNRIDKIIFVSEAEGYISARGGGQSYILRTITGGSEWVVLPQGKSGTAVVNSSLRDIAVCSKYANTAYAAGIAQNGTSGIALKMAG